MVREHKSESDEGEMRKKGIFYFWEKTHRACDIFLSNEKSFLAEELLALLDKTKA